VFFDITIADVN